VNQKKNEKINTQGDNKSKNAARHKELKTLLPEEKFKKWKGEIAAAMMQRRNKLQ
jgi:hypothetical protein